jgi:membrane-associated phospholipid phosphatase
VEKIMDPIIARVGWGWNLSFFYEHLNPNPVAAMPSLHAAYPWLVALVLARIDRRWGVLAALYSVLVWASIVYLGEHYAIDALAGAACATIAYAAVYHGAPLARWARALLTSPVLRPGLARRFVGLSAGLSASRSHRTR